MLLVDFVRICNLRQQTAIRSHIQDFDLAIRLKPDFVDAIDLRAKALGKTSGKIGAEAR